MASRRRLIERFAFASHAVHHHRRRRPVLEILEGRALLSTFTVNSSGDAGSGSGDAGDLRYCIAQANANDQANSIVFDSTVFSTPQTITLSGSQLELSGTGGTQTITGPAAGVTISGGGMSRVFQIDPGVTASISGLTISDGSAQGIGGGLVNYGTATLTDCTFSGNSVMNSVHPYGPHTDGDGGAVFNGPTAPGYGNYGSGAANLTMTDCTVSGNSAYASGGGVYSSGTGNLTMTDCTLSGNSAFEGGGAYIRGAANLTMTDCTVSGNSAGGGGGGLVHAGFGPGGTITINNCTVSGNSQTYAPLAQGGGGVANDSGTAYLNDCTISGNSAATYGGGVSNGGTAYLTDCTISSNSAATYGGGTWNSGTAYLTDCTLSGNSAGSGGGVADDSTVYLTDCTVSGNSAATDGGGLENCSLYSYFGIIDGAADLTDTIVAGNTNPSGASDIGGVSNVSGSNNLIGTGGSVGLVNGVNGNIVLTSLTGLGLAPLGNNGGPTQTMALLPGSAAIGAGVTADYPGTSTPITTDQRGEPFDSPNPDIGAYQTQGSTLIAPSFSGISNPSITYGTSGVTISGTLKSGSQAPVGETVAVTMSGVEQLAKIGSGGAFSTTFNTSGLTVANSPDTIAYAYTSDGTFSAASATSTLTVNPAPLTVTAANLSMTYGGTAPTLTYAYAGLVDGDKSATFTGSLSTTATSSSNVGNDAITEGTLAATGNYTIGAYKAGTLTVKPAPLTVTATNKSKVYGAAMPALTYTYTGLVNGNKSATFSGSPATTAIATSNVGSYSVTQGTLAATGNYTIGTFTPGTLTITKANQQITWASPAAIVYGTPLSSTQLDAKVSVVGPAPAGALTYSPASGTVLKAGAGQTLNVSVAGTTDYNPATYSVAITVKPAPLTVTATNESMTRGGAVPALTYTYTGLVNGDKIATFGGKLATTATSSSPVGSYPITEGTLKATGNYTIGDFRPGTLTVTATNVSKTAGGTVPAHTESVSPSRTAIVLVPHPVLKGKKTLSAVGLTAEIEPVSPGGGVPTGQVTFEFVKKQRNKVTVKTLGTAAMSGGAATLTFKPNKVLNKPLTIVYSGDPEFLASTMSPPKLTKKAML